MLPTFTTTTKEGRSQTDLYSDAVNTHREIWLLGEVNDTTAAEIIIQLRHLDRTDGDITLFINSPGGSVSAGFAIIDAINYCENDVSTVCTGMAASMAAFILSSGAKGKRYITPLGETMIHQPSGGTQGQASDMLITADHIRKIREKINNMLAEQTGRDVKVIEVATDRDCYMDADESVKFGLCDALYTRK